jgi:hypothetical protein
VQAIWPNRLWLLPKSQSLHFVWPASGWCLPAGHSLQTDKRTLSPYEPAAQRLQPKAPCVALFREKEPSGQGKYAERPVTLAKLPLSQIVQLCKQENRPV